MERPLEDDQCQVCGNYLFSHPDPYPWKYIHARKGTVRACSMCHERYGYSDDPRWEYRHRHVSAALARAERQSEALQEQLNNLNAQR